MIYERLVSRTFERDTGEKALSVSRLANSVFNVNRVFRVDAENGSYVFKAYRSAGYPEPGKAVFVAGLLARRGIPHARVLAHKQDDPAFPNGYVIEDFLPGTPADRFALTDGGLCCVYRKLADLLAEIHKIELPGYGFIVDGEPDCASFTDHVEKEFLYGDHNVKFVFSPAELTGIKRLLIKKLKPCDELPPCLCHNDAQLKNILVDGENIALVDWDDARAFPAAADVARLTLLIELGYDAEKAEDADKAALYKNAFAKRAYKTVENALHVWHGLVLLNFCPAESPQFQKIKTVVMKKLSSL